MTYARIDSAHTSVLVLESEPRALDVLGDLLTKHGHRAVLARTEVVAIDALAKACFDAAILSVENLESSCHAAKTLRSLPNGRDCPILFLTPWLDSPSAQKLSECGGSFSIRKPLDPYELLETIDRVLSLHHLARNKIGQSVDQSIDRQHSQSDWVRLTD